jgi:hypothetical protein
VNRHTLNRKAAIEDDDSTHSLRIVAVVAIVATGLVHFATARDSFGEATYKGLLLVANGVGALVASIGVYRYRAGTWSSGPLAGVESTAA